MSPLLLITVIAAVLFVVVFGAVWYLNTAQNTSSRRLLEYMRPFELAFDTIGKKTFASGDVEARWVVFDIHHDEKIRMRVRLNVPLEVDFHFATMTSRNYLVKHDHKDVAKWAKVGEKYYFNMMSAEPTAESLMTALKPETLAAIDQYDQEYGGFLLYNVDGQSLFAKTDPSLLQAHSELDSQMCVYGHYEITDKHDALDFRKFVRDTVHLAKSVEEDLMTLFPHAREASQPAKFMLKKKA